MIITDMGNCVGIMTLGSYGPSYLKYMLGVDIKTNGFLSGLPMLTRYLGGLFHAAIADYLFTKRDWSVLWVRRVFNSICMCGPAIGKKKISPKNLGLVHAKNWLFLKSNCLIPCKTYFKFFDMYKKPLARHVLKNFRYQNKSMKFLNAKSLPACRVRNFRYQNKSNLGICSSSI